MTVRLRPLPSVTLSLHDMVLYPVYVFVLQTILRYSPKTNGLPFITPDCEKRMDLPSVKESSQPKILFKSSSLCVVRYGSKSSLGTVFSISAIGISHVYSSLSGRICSRASSVFLDMRLFRALICLPSSTHFFAAKNAKMHDATHAATRHAIFSGSKE